MQKRLRAARAHDDERELAVEIRAKKLELAEAMNVREPVPPGGERADNVGSEGIACATCAVGKPGERGAYAGGDCCSGRAENVFSDDEVAALAQAGTRPRDLVPARGPAADPGCAFRGPTGCSLAVAHRPTVCVRYACQALQRQLHRSGRHVEALAAELGAALDMRLRSRARSARIGSGARRCCDLSEELYITSGRPAAERN